MLKQHVNPLWRQRADFRVELALPESGEYTEEIWVRKCGKKDFEVCCVPFFIYGLALGDVFRYVSKENFAVVSYGGRGAIRVYITDEQRVAKQLFEKLQQHNLQFEILDTLVAVDIPSDEPNAEFFEWLQAEEASKTLSWESVY